MFDGCAAMPSARCSRMPGKQLCLPPYLCHLGLLVSPGAPHSQRNCNTGLPPGRRFSHGIGRVLAYREGTLGMLKRFHLHAPSRQCTGGIAGQELVPPGCWSCAHRDISNPVQAALALQAVHRHRRGGQAGTSASTMCRSVEVKLATGALKQPHTERPSAEHDARDNRLNAPDDS